MYRLLFVLAASLAILPVASCSESYSPTAPSAPTPTPTPERTTSAFAGSILDADTDRLCIENARAEIIAGPSSGTVYPQNLQACNDPGAGFFIDDLPIGAVITLRLSAPGYTSVERDFTIVRSWSTIDINLKRAR